jgi:hypothetical protein
MARLNGLVRIFTYEAEQAIKNEELYSARVPNGKITRCYYNPSMDSCALYNKKGMMCILHLIDLTVNHSRVESIYAIRGLGAVIKRTWNIFRGFKNKSSLEIDTFHLKTVLPEDIADAQSDGEMDFKP